MKTVYEAPNTVEAQMILDLLERAGLSGKISGDYLQGGVGELAAEGKTVVFVSSYLPELLAVCDRIGVMARGKLREVRESEQWSEEQIMQVATQI